MNSVSDLSVDPSPHACVMRAWQAHEHELRGYLRHRLDDAEAAADVLQDVFVKALRQGAAFCLVAQPRAWLFQVARNAVVDRLRTTRPTDPLPDDLSAPDMPSLAPVDALAECLGRCLSELGDEDADILRRCDLEGQTVAAYADAARLSLPAAKSRLLRARQRLRGHLSRVCQVQFDADGRVGGHVPRPSLEPTGLLPSAACRDGATPSAG